MPNTLLNFDLSHPVTNYTMHCALHTIRSVGLSVCHSLLVHPLISSKTTTRSLYSAFFLVVFSPISQALTSFPQTNQPRKKRYWVYSKLV